MSDQYFRKEQIVEIFKCNDDFLRQLEEEELVHSDEVESVSEPVYLPDQVERIRIIRTLTHELDVNLAGAEVIISMRENMIRMQRQFELILEELVRELKTRLRD